jgi:hypothetical protein
VRAADPAVASAPADDALTRLDDQLASLTVHGLVSEGRSNRTEDGVALPL